jgi:hypothetical protein
MTDATKGMVGGGYYDAHSTFQADVAASVATLLKQAVNALSLPIEGKVTVADYGCGEGRNSGNFRKRARCLLRMASSNA